MLFDVSMPMPEATYLATALQLLGLRTLYGHPPDNMIDDYTHRLLQNNVQYPFMAQYDALCNLCGHAYFELHATYSDAQFLLVDWNPQDWLLNTRIQLAANNQSGTGANTIFRPGQINRMLNFGCLHTNDDNYLLWRLQQRKTEVVEFFADKPGKLLVMSPTDGWAPLCAFLNKPAPFGAFPAASYQLAPRTI